DRNPSLHVSPSKGLYKCFVCGAGGNVFTWIMETEHVDFVEALRILAKQAGVELRGRTKREPGLDEAMEAVMADAQTYFREQFEKSRAAREYCEGRGLDAGTIEEWELGYAPDVTSALATQLQRNGHKLALCEQLFLARKDSHGGYDDRFKGRLMFPIR